MAKKKPQPTADPVTPQAPEQSQGYTVLARRYRPQTFDEIIGQEPVARALAGALTSNRVAHAYLFTGARGVGKTSTARILAKCLNCERGPTPLPCNKCEICRSITEGEDVDVLEIDGASNNGVEAIRNLRGNVQYRPSRARYKIYIIDEVHMLSTAAFNALLKTLEEPPPHVKFIFATTDPQKIPVTIISRCQRFDLAGIPMPLIKEQLGKIAAQEGVQADDDALELVARRANGSMRDGESLLDQLLAFGEGRLTAAQVHQLLGTAGEEHVVTLAEAVLAGDSAATLGHLDRAAGQGFQMSELLDQMMAYWRDLMVASASGGTAKNLGVSSAHREKLLEQARSTSLDTILAGLEILSATRARLRDSSHARTLAEMALVRMSRLGDLMAVSHLVQLLGKAPQGQGVANAAVAPSMRVAPPEGVKKNLPTPAPQANGEVIPFTQQTAGAVWARVLGNLGMMLKSEVEKAETPATLGPNTLVLRFHVDYNKEREHCQQPHVLERLEREFEKVTGKRYSLRIESTGVSSQSNTSPVTESAPAGGWRSMREEAEREPLLRRALEALDAQVVRVDEGFGRDTTN